MSTWAAKIRAELAHIPILPLEELRRLPEAEEFDGGIYFFWQGDELVYVGKSANILERIYRQIRSNRMGDDRLIGVAPQIPFDRHTALVLERGQFRENAERMDGMLKDYERAYMAHYEPRYNHLTDVGGMT